MLNPHHSAGRGLAAGTSLLLLVLTGCGNSMHTGTVSGTFQIVTAAVAHQVIPGTGQVIVRKGTQRVAEQRVRSGSTFVLTVPPGTYQITSVCLQSRHETQLSVPKTVSVEANVTTRADVRCLLSPKIVAVTLPKAGVIEVTGYQVVGYAGSRGPVTVVVKGQSAKVLRTALESAPPWTPPRRPICLEELDPFIISVLPRRGALPTMVIRALDVCDGQYVMVTVGKLTTDVKDECALQSAVVAALPLGQAQGTRELIADVCATSPTH